MGRARGEQVVGQRVRILPLHQHSGRIPGPAGAVGASDGGAAPGGDLRIRPVRKAGRWARLRAKGGDPPRGGGRRTCRFALSGAPVPPTIKPSRSPRPSASPALAGPARPARNRAVHRARRPVPVSAGAATELAGTAGRRYALRGSGANRDSWPSQLRGYQWFT